MNITRHLNIIQPIYIYSKHDSWNYIQIIITDLVAVKNNIYLFNDTMNIVNGYIGIRPMTTLLDTSKIN